LEVQSFIYDYKLSI